MKKVTNAIVAAAAAAGIAIAAAPSASANTPELEYLYDLNLFGLTVYDTAAALNTGYTICGWRDRGMTEAGAVEQMFASTTWADVPTREVAMIWVAAAEVNLCPEHAHTGTGTTRI